MSITYNDTSPPTFTLICDKTLKPFEVKHKIRNVENLDKEFMEAKRELTKLALEAGWTVEGHECFSPGDDDGNT